jgi:hypothetical protein
MTFKLDQTVCLSLAGGFAIVAPPSFPRNRTSENDDAPPRAGRIARDDDAPNKRARSRSRRAS